MGLDVRLLVSWQTDFTT